MMRTCLVASSLAAVLGAELWEDSDFACGIQLLQSSSSKRVTPGIYKVPKMQLPGEAIPFASLVSESSQLESSHQVVLNQIKQVVALAQTRVQTKVGEAPYFIIAVAIGGFALSLLSICVSLIFVERGLSKEGGRGEPNASALLAQRLRALGVGEAGRYRHRSEMNPARTWEHGDEGPGRQKRSFVDGRNRLQIVVRQPLEGGRVGLNLSEDDLVVNNFGDLRAYDFGFRIGDRLVQVNQVPVFKETDFRFVMQDALQRHSERGEPIVFHVVRQATSQSLSMAPHAVPSIASRMATDENGEDLRGSWRYGDAHTEDLYSYLIRQVGHDLGFEQELPDGEKISGVLVREGLWLRSDLQGRHGFHGEIRLQYDPEEKVLVSQFKKKGETKWSSDVLARRAKG